MTCCEQNIIWPSCDHQQLLLAALIAALGVSLLLNIFCTFKHCSGKRTSRGWKRRQMQMEENPIYGNMDAAQTGSSTETSFTASGRRDPSRINAMSEDCYTNLSLLRAVSGSVPGSPLSPVDPDKDPEEAQLRVSDLYASVQPRAKTPQRPHSSDQYKHHKCGF